MSELDKSFKSACRVRDDSKSTARDVNEANKFIARVLNALAPDRTVTESKKVAGKVQELDDEMLERIKDEYTPKVTPRANERPEDVVPKSDM